MQTLLPRVDEQEDILLCVSYVHSYSIDYGDMNQTPFTLLQIRLIFGAQYRFCISSFALMLTLSIPVKKSKLVSSRSFLNSTYTR